MSSEGAFRAVRNEVFERSPVLAAPTAEVGVGVGGAEVVAAAHRFKSWVSLRGRLRPAQVRQARERGEEWALGYDQYLGVLRRIGEIGPLRRRVETVEDVIELLWAYVQDLALIPPLLPTAPGRRGWEPWPPSQGTYAGETEERRRELPPELLAELLGILGKLTGEFLAQLEEVGRFELPPILPAPVQVDMRILGEIDRRAGPPGAIEVGAVVSDFGDTVVLTGDAAAGGSVSVTSPTLAGPAVIERILFSQSSGLAGTLELRAQGAGVTGATGVGDALLIGATGAVVTVEGVAFFGDWWPRRLLRTGSFQLFMRYVNNGAAANTVMVGFDRRDVIWPAPSLRPLTLAEIRARTGGFV